MAEKASMTSAVPDRVASLIGVVKRRRVAVTERDIRRFADAIGQALSETPGGDGLTAPPLFFQTMTYEEIPLPELAGDGSPQELNVPIPAQRTVGGGSSYEVFRNARAGDVVTVESRLKDVYTKTGKSGLLYFVVVETKFLDDSDAPMAIETATYIKRH